MIWTLNGRYSKKKIYDCNDFFNQDDPFEDDEVSASQQVIFTITEIEDENGQADHIKLAFEPPIAGEVEFEKLPENMQRFQNLAAKVANHVFEKMGE